MIQQKLTPLMISVSNFLDELKILENSLEKINDKEKTEKIKLKINEIENTIIDKFEILLNQKHELIQKIDQIDDDNEKIYLQEKLLNQKTNQEIATILNYSIRNVYYIQEKAIKHLLEIEKNKFFKKSVDKSPNG